MNQPPEPRPLPEGSTKCTLCAAVRSPGFYTGCLLRDGHDPGNEWNCDGKGNLTLKALPALSVCAEESAEKIATLEHDLFVAQASLAEKTAEVEKLHTQLENSDSQEVADALHERDCYKRLAAEATETITDLREENERLREKMKGLIGSAREVQRYGAQTGSQWLRLGSSIIYAEAALLPAPVEAAGEEGAG